MPSDAPAPVQTRSLRELNRALRARQMVLERQKGALVARFYFPQAATHGVRT